MLVIPIVFLSLSALNPTVIFWNFLFFALGRVIPIVVVGTMPQDAQMRFIRALSARSGALNKRIGIVMIEWG
jgi:cytochrome c biogenesis protein CcdA